MGRFQLESIYLYFPPSTQLLYLCFCPEVCSCGYKCQCRPFLLIYLATDVIAYEKRPQQMARQKTFFGKTRTKDKGEKDKNSLTVHTCSMALQSLKGLKRTLMKAVSQIRNSQNGLLHPSVDSENLQGSNSGFRSIWEEAFQGSVAPYTIN